MRIPDSLLTTKAIVPLLDTLIKTKNVIFMNKENQLKLDTFMKLHKTLFPMIFQE